jgi:hypothetical protein
MIALVPKAAPFNGPVSVHVLVDNPAAYRREFEAAGIAVRVMPPASSPVNPASPAQFAVDDPDGNRLTFVQEPRPARPR